MNGGLGALLLGGTLFLMFGVYVPWVFWNAYIRKPPTGDPTR